MRFRRLISLVCVIGPFASPVWAQSALSTPDDLIAVQIADDSLVPNCYTISVDGQRLFASGPGYIRVLLDDDEDGIMDRFETFSDRPATGAHGLYSDLPDVFAVGDQGILHFRDEDGDLIADSAPKVALEIKVGGEHHAHALRRGPDGWWYLLAGNQTGANALLNDPDSPIKDPRAGTLWRISPDWQLRSVWAHGFRNAYDFDFLADGSMIVFDSDGERDVTLPWYRPTRVFSVSVGSDAGWFSRSWKQPDYFSDMPSVIAQLGRGSPTGVLAGHRTRLAKRMCSGAIVLDWTFGRVVHVSENGRSIETIAEPDGTRGFAVTDAAPTSDGALLVSVGGRGSSGGIYRIESKDPVEEIVSDRSLADHRSGMSVEDAMARLSAAERSPRQIVSALTTLGLHADLSAVSLAALSDHAPALLTHDDASVRRVIGWLAARQSNDWWHGVYSDVGLMGKTILWLGLHETRGVDVVSTASLEHAADVLAEANPSRASTLSALRLIVVSLGDHGPALQGDTRSSIDRAAVFDGYRSRLAPAASSKWMNLIVPRVSRLCDHTDETIVDEAMRVLAVLQTDSPIALQAIVRQLDRRDDPTAVLHCLMCLARVRGQRSDMETEATAAAMIQFPLEITQRKKNVERNFEPRMRELYNALSYHDLLLEPAIVTNPSFGQPEHLLWAEQFRPESKKMARTAFLRKYRSADFPSDVARFVAGSYTPLPRALIRQWIAERTTHDAGIIALAQHPRTQDFQTFALAVGSSNQAVALEACAAIEVILRSEPERSDLLDARSAQSLWRASQGDPKGKVPMKVNELLGQLVTDPGNVRGELESRFAGSTSAEPAPVVGNWAERVAKIDFSIGHAEAGKTIFYKLQCERCHGGRKAMGPDLAGARRRFSQADLLRAIYAPDADIPDRYRAKQVVTVGGDMITGNVIYSSTDGLTLMDAQGETRRVNQSDIDLIKDSPNSLMPTGLIDKLSDDEIASLVRYIQGL